MIYKKLGTSLNTYQLYGLIQREYPESFLFESLEGPEKMARFSYIGFSPKKHIRATGVVVDVDGEEEDAAQPIQTLARNIPKIPLEKEGFVGGAVGYFSYDYARTIEKFPRAKSCANEDIRKKREKDLISPTKRPDFPDFEFGVFDDCIVYDHRERTVNYLSHGDDRSNDIVKLTKEESFLGPFESGTPKCNMGEVEFERSVRTAKEHIANGDIFQVVLSRRYAVPYEGNLLRFYNYLKQTNPSPYMYFLSFGDRKIIGSSPENLVRVEGNKIDSFATLAGTMPRGKTLAQDAELETRLRNDPKERAEHLMLVDLTRNDVGKVARIGSVDVPELMEVHKYSHVQHLASHVSAELAPGKDCFDALNALFPAGTLSGAPKVRAMEIIDELEPTRRGPYGGAVGYFSFNRNCDFAITIRTLVAKRQKAYVQAGAGIVYDSKPETEYLETENKMRAILGALEVRFP